MPSTNYPNGLSTTTAVHTVNNHIVTNTMTVGSMTVSGAATISGALTLGSTITVGSGSQLVGQTYYFPLAFGTSSALQQIASPIPGFTNCSLEAVYHTVSTVSALVAAYTVQVGSAGAIAVATVSNITSSVGVVQSLATTATTFDGTASSVVCIRSVQGTAGDSQLTLVIRRTA